MAWPAVLKRLSVAPAATLMADVARGADVPPVMFRRPPRTEVEPVYVNEEPESVRAPMPSLTKLRLFSFVPVPPMAPV